jgi:hypothetical protein
MDYSRIIDDLNSASLFDLFRLSVAIHQQLDEPQRIAEVRAKLRPGMEITFFDGERNHLVKARVLKLNRTRLDVHSLLDHRDWSIRYCTVNLGNVETDIKPNKTLGITRTQLKIGDSVGFCDRQNREKYGRVIGLNQKTASILVNESEKWRVAYSLLFPIIEGGEVE